MEEITYSSQIVDVGDVVMNMLEEHLKTVTYQYKLLAEKMRYFQIKE